MNDLSDTNVTNSPTDGSTNHSTSHSNLATHQEMIGQLRETVQHNCHISDSRYAGEYTLCVYLLKMREMYRWEQQESFKTQLTTDDVGDWLTEREALWDEVEEQDYQPLTINGKEYEAFDNESVNPLLEEYKLVYNAGLGIRCRPHFFLAELERSYIEQGYQVLVSGKELARDMAAPPAMTQGNTIYIRLESLRRMLWEKVEEWSMSPLDNAMGRCIEHYDFNSDNVQALDSMMDAEFPFVVKHEIGEAKAGEKLGEDWLEMLSSIPATKAEIMLRAIRDLYADGLVLLPELLEKGSEANIHFYFGNLSAMRKHLAPTLINSYKQWHDDKDIKHLDTLPATILSHFGNLCEESLVIYQTLRENNELDRLSGMIEKKIEKASF